MRDFILGRAASVDRNGVTCFRNFVMQDKSHSRCRDCKDTSHANEMEFAEFASRRTTSTLLAHGTSPEHDLLKVNRFHRFGIRLNTELFTCMHERMQRALNLFV
jgi:hypothetical protein